jgi:hypothetical protein
MVLEVVLEKARSIRKPDIAHQAPVPAALTV